MLLNTERIFGTDEKRLQTLFQKLQTEWTQGDAEEYYTMYCGKDAAFVINSSEMIFSEPYKGLAFYDGWVPFIPVTALESEFDKFSSYVDSVGDRMHPDTRDEYERVREHILERIHCCGGYIPVISALSNKYAQAYTLLYDLSTAVKRSQETGKFDEVNEVAYKMPPLLALLSLGSMFYSDETVIANLVSRLESTKASAEINMAEALKESVYMSYVNDCDAYRQFAESVKNPETRLILKSVASVDAGTEYDEMVKSMLKDEVVLPDVSPDNFVEAVLAEDAYERAMAERHNELRKEIYQARRAMYEAAFDVAFAEFERNPPDQGVAATPVIESMKEMLGVSGNTNVETALMLSVESLATLDREIAALEYTVDGSPNKVIQKRNNILREGGATNAIQKNPVDEDDDDIPSTSRVSSADLPDSGNPNSKKPTVPKSGVAGKIQNAAMDAHSASKRAGGAIKSAGQKVVNAGKAVLKIPADLVAGLKRAIDDFNTMDENHRKAYMVKPGYRKKIFKNLRVAAMYGASAYIGGYMVIITWIGRKLSKEKNRRLRREFAAELATEIKVCEAKIEDATAAGHQEQRYKLMRLRDKLEQEKSRVELNAKYI